MLVYKPEPKNLCNQIYIIMAKAHTFGLDAEASMIILSPIFIPRVAMVTSSTNGDCALEDCFTVAMPLGEGALVAFVTSVCTAERKQQ